jgi:uncharacterized SAM-binding protein YcdF (DUF218 family)
MIFWRRSNKFATIVLWTIFSVAIFLLLVTFTGVNKILIAPLVRNETPQQADVIIILGGGIVTDLKMLPWAVQERVKRGIELYKEDYADSIIVTGGVVKGQNYTESSFMREYAELLSASSEDIIEEKRSKSTYDNAVYSLQIMDENDWQTVLLVTSDFHTKRACRVFKKVEIDITCLAAYPDPGFEKNYFRNLVNTQSILREYVAIVYYFVRGYI